MKTTAAALFSLSLLPLLGLASACASSSAPESAPPLGQSAAPATAADVTGTWAFVLARSDVADAVRADCATEAAGDVAKANACYAEVETQAAKEKIRFSKDASGRTVWKSFGVDGEKEVTFLEVPVEIASDGPGRVLAKVAGSATGTQAQSFGKASVSALRIEVVDGRTIAMTDPKKGRLVYTKE